MSCSAWLASITPILRVFPSAMNFSPTATLVGGVDPSQGPLTRVIHQSLCEKQFTLPSRHSLDVDVAGDGNAS
jgi:hypothetical protein